MTSSEPPVPAGSTSLPVTTPAWPDPVTTSAPDGTSIATYDLGGHGGDVLFVHATGFCAAVWAPVAHRLDGHRRAALDVRGHGRSAVPVAGMDWHGTASDVLATVDALGLERPFGVGHSMGGASLLLAEQARPGTFSGLWLFEPIVFPPALRQGAGSGNPLAEGARRRRDRFDSVRAAYDNFAGKPPFDALDPEALAAYVTHGFRTADDGSVQLRCRPEVEASTYEMGSVHAAFEHLGEVRCRVTVVRGTDRVPGPASFAPAVAAALPDASLEDHPELGHFGPLEAPQVIADSIEFAVGAAS
jgi:pimeloyl-ACP methyl ester carboxylesterase